jgi:hypothetical protein
LKSAKIELHAIAQTDKILWVVAADLFQHFSHSENCVIVGDDEPLPHPPFGDVDLVKVLEDGQSLAAVTLSIKEHFYRH